MSPMGAELRERIKTLLEANNADAEDIDEVLTAGYGYALSLDSKRLRTERFHTIWRKGYDKNFEAYAVTAQHPGFIDTLRASGISSDWAGPWIST